jgi:hypothetical protein
MKKEEIFIIVLGILVWASVLYFIKVPATNWKTLQFPPAKKTDGDFLEKPHAIRTKTQIEIISKTKIWPRDGSGRWIGVRGGQREIPNQRFCYRG